MLDLRAVFDCLCSEKLYAKRKKCFFGQTLVKYLGHIVESGRIRTDPDKVEAICTWPKPTTVKELQYFLGLANYYAQYIPHYADIAAPLTDLASPKRSWTWGADQDRAFDQLRELLCNPPVLQLPNFELPFVIDTDACRDATGTVLLQQYDDSLHPIA